MIQSEASTEKITSATLLFNKAERARQDRLEQPTSQEQELMNDFGLDLEAAKYVLHTAEYLKSFSGYVEFDLEQIDSWDLAEASNQQLADYFEMISQLMTQIHLANSKVDLGNVMPANHFSIFFSDLRNSDDADKHQKKEMAILHLLAEKPTIFHEQYNKKQYLEVITHETSDSDSFSQLKPEIFEKLFQVRSKLLNLAVQKMLPRTKNMSNPEMIRAVLSQHFPEGHFLIEVANAIVLIREIENIGQMPIVPIDSDKEFIRVSVPLNETEKLVLLGGKTAPRNYGSQIDLLSHGRQWLEIGDGITYKDIAKQAMILYLGLGEFTTGRGERETQEKNPSWFDEDIQRELQFLGVEGFLNKSIEGFDKIQPIFRAAFVKVFQSFIDSAARRKITESKTYYGFNGDVRQQRFRDIEIYIANMLKLSENSPLPLDLFARIQREYPQLRKTRKLGVFDQIAFRKSEELDFKNTFESISNVDFHSIFSADIIRSLINDYLEPKYLDGSLRVSENQEN